MCYKTCYSQHSMGREATCRANTRPGGATGGTRGRCVRNTKRTRVFFLPTSVSPFLSSMSEFLSFRIPAQSMLQHTVSLYSSCYHTLLIHLQQFVHPSNAELRNAWPTESNQILNQLKSLWLKSVLDNFLCQPTYSHQVFGFSDMGVNSFLQPCCA